MKTVNVHEAKTRLSALLAEVEQEGTEILICRHGKPVADLIPHRQRQRLSPHPLLKRIEIKYDAVEPLSDDEWPEGSR